MILGVTGSIGCGKSTVLDLFEAASWRTADADAICRELYDDPEGDFAAACRERWGEAFFSDGKFDRAKIARTVFADPEQLRRLTELIYPHLERKLDEFAQTARRDGVNAAVEVPLLYENGMEKRFDAVLTVWAPAELRHERLRKFRNFDEAEIRRREALQMDPDEKLERADYALVNSGDAALLKAEFEKLLPRLTGKQDQDMSERNENDAQNDRPKRGLGSILAHLRRLLKPEILRPAAVCGFMLLLLLCECIAFFFSKIEVRSIVRPFLKGAGLYLAIFGLSLLPGGRATKILLSFWLALMGVTAAVGTFLYMRFALDMNCDCFFVLAVSSSAEVKEFLDRFLTWKLALALGAAAVVCGAAIAFVWRTGFKRSRLNTAVSLLLLLPFALQCAFLVFVVKDPPAVYCQSNLPRAIFGYFAYRKRLAWLLKMEKSPQLPAGIRPLAGSERIVGVLAIGESANCNHWGAYGYPRDTTPQIDKRIDSCIVYDDMVAAAAWTGGAIYRMFTNATVFRGRATFTFIDVLRAAGWRVVLISNHNRWGRKDGPIGIITAHCNRRIYMQDLMKYPFDGDMLPVLEEELRNAPGGRLLIVVHLMGSHQTFSARYPRVFSRFDGVRDRCNSGMSAAHARELNEYDNTIAYTDSVLGGILEQLEKLKNPAFMIYCSDHSELGEWSGYRHARSVETAIPDIYEIPFVFWTNEEYRRNFPRFAADAARNRHAPIQADRLIWSIVSAAQVTFDGFPREKDVFSGELYRPPERRRMKYRTPYRPSEAKKHLRRTRRLPSETTGL